MSIAKKKRKNISLGVVYVKATFNNTIVTFTDIQGNVIAFSTAGSNNFKGARKATPYAAQVTVDRASEAVREHGLKTVYVRTSGGGGQKESAIRALFTQGFIIPSISDISPTSFGGCRAPKKRRV